MKKLKKFSVIFMLISAVFMTGCDISSILSVISNIAGAITKSIPLVSQIIGNFANIGSTSTGTTTSTSTTATAATTTASATTAKASTSTTTSTTNAKIDAATAKATTVLNSVVESTKALASTAAQLKATLKTVDPDKE